MSVLRTAPAARAASAKAEPSSGRATAIQRWGVPVLLAAVAFDVYNKTQGKKSIIGMMMKNFGRRSEELAPDETTSTKEVISKEA